MTFLKLTMPRLAALAVALLLGGLCGYAVAQDMSPLDRQERCANNRARLAELQREGNRLSEQNRGMWSPQKMLFAELALTRLTYIKADQAALSGAVTMPSAGSEDLDRAIVGTWNLCMADMQRSPLPADAAAVRLRNNRVCVQAVCAGLERAIDDAKRQEKRANASWKAIEDQIHAHQANLVALRCDVPEAGYALAGEWSLDRGFDTGWMKLWMGRDGSTLTGYLAWFKHIGTATVESFTVSADAVKFRVKYAGGEVAVYEGKIEAAGQRMSGTMTSTAVAGGEWTARKTK